MFYNTFRVTRYGVIVVVINQYTLRVTLERIVCFYRSFCSIFGIKHKFTKYLKESCCLSSDQHFSFKWFPENAFAGEIYHKSPRPVLAALSFNGVTLPMMKLLYISPKHKDAEIFENHLNPVMLVFIG